MEGQLKKHLADSYELKGQVVFAHQYDGSYEAYEKCFRMTGTHFRSRIAPHGPSKAFFMTHDQFGLVCVELSDWIVCIQGKWTKINDYNFNLFFKPTGYDS